MKRWMIALVAVAVATLVVTAGTALAGNPVQSSTQSADTDQAALAASSATQVQPSNENVSVRIFSPGDDGSVSQSNDALSSAKATNTASTTQSANQNSSSSCGCAIAGLESGDLSQVLPGAMQAADSADPSPKAAPAGSTQSNDAASSGTATNAAPTTQSSSQSGSAGGGVQSSTQDASTDQKAAAASSAKQIKPSNTNVSVRIFSPGDDGSVDQSNKAASSADATNYGKTTQTGTQTGSGGGVQSSIQKADTDQKAAALSSAKQIEPENSNVSVRILSPGDNGNVSQSNEALSSASAKNIAPVTQTSTQSGSGSSCGCDGPSHAVQAIAQKADVDQFGVAASSADQYKPSNSNDPVRIGSYGDDGSTSQSNKAASSAWTTNDAPVTQTGTQTQSDGCGCSSHPAVQAIGQKSEVGQLGIALSSAKQIGASNESAPVRIKSSGDGGYLSQENDAASSASAHNSAPTVQSGTQTQSGSGVQALAQKASIWQAGLAASSAFQAPGRSECGCSGSSFGNFSGPVRIESKGDDGALKQKNAAYSRADASNYATPTQTSTQTQSPSRCGCDGLGVQAVGQAADVGQLAAALSLAKQIGASNASDPVRIKSYGGTGSSDESNAGESSAYAPNLATGLQSGRMVHF